VVGGVKVWNDSAFAEKASAPRETGKSVPQFIVGDWNSAVDHGGLVGREKKG